MSGTTWWGKMRSVTPSVPDNVPILKAEVTALEELSRFLFLEAHEVQNALERIEWSKSCQGMYFNFLGYFFSLYCVWKIFISTVNIVFDRVGKMDPITKTFDILVNWLGKDLYERILGILTIVNCRLQYRRDYVVPAVKLHSCWYNRVHIHQRLDKFPGLEFL